MSEHDRREGERARAPSWAITGTGQITSLGGSVAASFEAYCRGETGLAPLRAFDRSKYRITSAYEVAEERTQRQRTGWHEGGGCG